MKIKQTLTTTMTDEITCRKRKKKKTKNQQFYLDFHNRACLFGIKFIFRCNEYVEKSLEQLKLKFACIQCCSLL